MVAVMHNLSVVLERLHLVVEHFRHFIVVPLELLLEPLSKSIARLPNFELGLEVCKALPNKLDVEDAGHAFLSLAERLELVLQEIDLKLSVFVFQVGTLQLVVIFHPHFVDIDPEASASLSLPIVRLHVLLLDVHVHPTAGPLHCLDILFLLGKETENVHDL